MILKNEITLGDQIIYMIENDNIFFLDLLGDAQESKDPKLIEQLGQCFPDQTWQEVLEMRQELLDNTDSKQLKIWFWSAVNEFTKTSLYQELVG